MSINLCAPLTTPMPFVVNIPATQWSGSDSDYYITVSASNITENSILIPHYDEDSADVLKGPIWCVPTDGSFTIHTTAIPDSAVTILIQFAGTNGVAQYQVLADVYSTSQAVAKADIVNVLTSTATDVPLSAAQGKVLADGKVKEIYFDSADTTWAKVFAKLDTIPQNRCAGIVIHQDVMTILTNGEITGMTARGFVARSSATTFDFKVSTSTGNPIATWRITNATSSSCTTGAVNKYRPDYKYYYNGAICSSSATSSGDVFSYFTNIPNGGYLLILYRSGYTWDDAASVYIVQHGSTSSVYGKLTIKEGSNSNCPKLNSSGNVTLPSASEYAIGITLIKLN